ncbi:sulfite exporter TauE/SafE family protein [Apilactobacillus timberlakei]|nr:sulfite exporter TauE/SafE family protein [Apilactobacillus timberlakei]TPR19374.1 sulfite exporter TauE/SafE family protein [Apilactobacillus timberlakei]TPR19423.1 sulfite exporter TauE/SafE family protein [Apilactobacillus timberlakei]TPR20801.1 sulfite exporter TauE/SafE family protein [Apilactobacillus timberlakei]TPR22204.1 sulfite exporter TauE/SafE family protein [Apilactobacillus timberlakei]
MKRRLIKINIFGISIWIILLFIPVGVLAGILGTVTGLASLASYPALLYFAGLPAVSANVVNKAALMFNSIGSAISSTQELHGHWKELFKTMIIIFFGGITGAILLTALPSSSFTHIVPVFIAAGGIMILIPSKNEENHEGANNFEPRKGHVNQHSWFRNILIIFLVYLIGAYSGYFGAASGILLLVLLTRTSSNEYTVSNAIRNVAMGAANIVATIYYSFEAHIVWILVLPLGIGFFIGGYIGPKIVRILPVKYIRILTGILALILAYTQFSSAYNIKIFYLF